MTTPASNNVTQLLLDWSSGDKDALDKLIPLVYKELRHLARNYMRKERAGHTLQTSALVNEAYLRLIDYRQMQWQNRAHFFAVAAQAMRRVLVDHARAQQAAKRGAGGQKVSLDEAAMISEVRAEELLALDEALGKLEQLDERRCRIVEMLYIAGLSTEEVAGVMSISTRTVEREWRSAKAWLYKAISEGNRDEC